MKIAVAGIGYVGLSVAVLLAQRHDVVLIDIEPGKVQHIISRTPPFDDPEIARYLREVPLRLHATLNPKQAYEGADYVVVATPTDFDPVVYTSAPTATMPFSMSRRLPAIVISSTGCTMRPPSTQKPDAPRE